MARGYPTPLSLDRDHFDGLTSLHTSGLTLIHPFFGETERFDKLFEIWRSYSGKVKESLNIVVIDDCGDPAIHTLMPKSRLKRCDFNLSIYRITTPLWRNTPGALNLGLMCSDTPWSLIMDSDCTFVAEEMEKVMALRPRSNWIYHFDRTRVTRDAHWAENTRFLPCTILMPKPIFLDVAGFDEDFTGEYSRGWAFFDNHFNWKVRMHDYWAGIPKWITATEYMPDEVGPRLPRNRDEERINKKLMYAKKEGKIPNSSRMLRFDWERTLHRRRER